MCNLGHSAGCPGFWPNLIGKVKSIGYYAKNWEQIHFVQQSLIKFTLEQNVLKSMHIKGLQKVTSKKKKKECIDIESFASI